MAQEPRVELEIVQEHNTEAEMVQQHNVDVPRPAGGANGGVVGSLRPRELQNMRLRLVVDVGDGRTIEIPLQGYLTLSATPSQASTTEATGEHSTAVAESEDAAEARKYLDNMRGWIMMVAALFVSISFEAILQWPSWMAEPKDAWKYLFGKYRNTTDPAQKEVRRAIGYVMTNTLTFSTSLMLVVQLILPSKSSPESRLITMRAMMIAMAILVAMNFASMVSKDLSVVYFTLTIMGASLLIMMVTLIFLAIKFASTL